LIGVERVFQLVEQLGGELGLLVEQEGRLARLAPAPWRRSGADAATNGISVPAGLAIAFRSSAPSRATASRIAVAVGAGISALLATPREVLWKTL